MSGDFTFLKGNIETIILCALYKEPKYGYEIAKEIKERTNNRYEIKQPTLYSYLKRLEEDDLIVSYWGEASNGGRRRYYALTNVGRANCEQFISEWQYCVGDRFCVRQYEQRKHNTGRCMWHHLQDY